MERRIWPKSLICMLLLLIRMLLCRLSQSVRCRNGATRRRLDEQQQPNGVHTVPRWCARVCERLRAAGLMNDCAIRQGTSRWEARRPSASRVSLASPPPPSPGWVSEMPSGDVFPRDRVRCAVTPSLCAAACTPFYVRVKETSNFLTLACGPKPAATNEAERSGQATPTS